MKISKLVFFFLISTSILGCNSENNKPNIILIMADDLGYNDISCYGNIEIQTPNIDYLANNGIRFLDYHSSGAVCSPTRAALMTGRYQQRSGIEGVVTAKSHRLTGLAVSEFTLADFLKSQGYVTGLIGKWHLGYDTAFSPVNNGFDYFKGFVSGNVDYHSHFDQEGYFDWWEYKDTLDEDGYTTDLFTKAALDFIEQNQDNPFFLYLAHEAPHYPYQGRNDPPMRKERPNFKIEVPKVDIPKTYKEMIEVMDEGIGLITDDLRSKNLLSNTLIFFCSDNGAAPNGSNKPLRGHKASLWEGGHRVPAIAFWDGKIYPDLSEETVISMDFFPTIVDLINPDYEGIDDFDGLSFMSILSDKYEDNGLSERPIFWRFKNKKAIRSGDWKLLLNGDNQFLFNLKNDISETNNLIGQYKGKADSLLSEIELWEMEMDKYEMRSN